MKDPEACCEIILFTDSAVTLEEIDRNDWLNEHEIASSNFDETQRISHEDHEDRPMTATRKFSTTEMEEL